MMTKIEADEKYINDSVNELGEIIYKEILEHDYENKDVDDMINKILFKTILFTLTLKTPYKHELQNQSWKYYEKLSKKDKVQIP